MKVIFAFILGLLFGALSLGLLTGRYAPHPKHENMRFDKWTQTPQIYSHYTGWRKYTRSEM